MIPERTIARCHELAADAAEKAARALSRAVTFEDGLEFDSRLREVLVEVEALTERLRDYAARAAQPWDVT